MLWLDLYIRIKEVLLLYNMLIWVFFFDRSVSCYSIISIPKYKNLVLDVSHLILGCYIIR